MDETPFPPDENELTEQDLAILRAFAAMEDLPVAQSSAPITSLPTPTLAQSDNDETDMAVLFATEAAEDIDVMRQAIRQLERQDAAGATMTQFRTLQRTAHKLKGTAAAIDCIAISTIARALEVLSGQVASNLVPHSE